MHRKRCAQLTQQLTAKAANWSGKPRCPPRAHTTWEFAAAVIQL
jgi:hypothetical protein